MDTPQSKHHHTLLLHDVLVATPHSVDGAPACVTVDGDTITGVYFNDDIQRVLHTHTATEVVNGRGALLMPGVIDCHVHFRDPGLTHKADMCTESRAAVAGGVTSFIDMPNTVPQTVTRDDLMRKHERAAQVSLANYGFFIGATSSNLSRLREVNYHTESAGVKVFMGSSTGNMLVNSRPALEAIFAEVDAPIVVHAENQEIIDGNTARFKAVGRSEIANHWIIRSSEACARATDAAINLALRYGSRLHVAHLSTADETRMFDAGAVSGKKITCEVSPLHLTFSSDDYAALGSRIKVNPAIKTPVDRRELIHALCTDRIDIVATDHAPHLLSEKDGDVFTAVSGAPMIQFSLPVMLGMLNPWQTAVKMSIAPAECFAINRRGAIAPGMYADMALVQEVEPYIVTDNQVISRCAWTPLHGRSLRHKVVRTWVGGSTVYQDGEVAVKNVAARALEFSPGR